MTFWFLFFLYQDLKWQNLMHQKKILFLGLKKEPLSLSSAETKRGEVLIKQTNKNKYK